MKNDKKLTLKDKWNEPLEKEEFKKILIKSIICMVLISIVAGFLNYLFLYHNANVLGGIILIPVFVGAIINRNIEKVHIKYYLIGIILTILGIFLSNALAFIFFNCFTLKYSLGAVFASANFYKFIFILPIELIVTSSTISAYIYAIVNLVFYILSIVGVYFLIGFRKK